VRRAWDEVLGAVRTRSRPTQALLAEVSVAQLSGRTLTLAFRHAPLMRQFQGRAGVDVVKEALQEVLGADLDVVCSLGPADHAPAAPAAAAPAGRPAPARAAAARRLRARRRGGPGGPRTPPPPAPIPPCAARTPRWRWSSASSAVASSPARGLRRLPAR
jgi:DNA polymerase-3 subunit gamma/tau